MFHHWITTAAASVLLSVVTGAASPELYLRHVADLDGFTGGIYSMALEGSRLFVCHQVGGMSVVDVSNPETPMTLGTYKGRGQAAGVATEGSFAFLCEAQAGLAVLDVSDPASPRRVGGYDTGGVATRATLHGGMAFVAGGTSLVILDISDPTRLRKIASLTSPGGLSDVAIAGEYAFLAGGSRGVLVADIRDPASPVLITNINPGNQFVGTVALSGNSLYASALGRGFALDIRVPDQPTFTTFLVPPTRSSAGVAASSRFIALAEGDNSLRILQNRGDLSPVLLARSYAGPSVTAVELNDRHAFVAAGTSVQVFSLDEPANPGTAATQPLPPAPGSSSPYLFTSGNGFLRIAQRDAVVTVQTGIPGSPVTTSTNQFSPFGPENWVENGDRAVCWRTAWYWTVDLSSPERPRVAASLTAQPSWQAFALAGTRGFAAGLKFLSSIDLSDLSQPRTLITQTNALSYGSLAVLGDHLYAAQHEPAIEVLDIRDREKFQLLGKVPLGAPASLQVVSNRLYAFAYQQPRVTVYSLDNPSAPEVLGEYEHRCLLRNAFIQGSYLYARPGAATDAGFEVFDVSDPKNIRRVAGNSFPVFGLLSDGHALYATGDGLLRTLPLYSETPAYRPVDLRYAAGAFRFRVRVAPGTTAQVWRAGMLTEWTAWRSLTFADEFAEIEDGDPSTSGGWFYRVESP